MPPRPLPFPLDYSATDSALTPIGEELPALPEFPIDPDEKIVLAFEMSLNEFVKIASTIDVGSDIAYPEDSVGIWYLWSRSVMPDNICALIAACIANPSSETYAALNQYIASASSLNLISQGLTALGKGKQCDCPGMSEENATQGLGTETNPTCDLNILWGQCQAVIEFLDQTGRDAIEIVGAWQNNNERIAGALRAIPAIETLPIDDLFNLTAWLADEGLQYYEAGSTVENKLNWACALFCLCKDDCQITIRRVADALNSTANEEFVPVDLFDFAQIALKILTNGIGPTFAWWAFQSLIIGASAQAADFFGAQISWRLIDLVVANGVEGASDGWQLCGCAPPPPPSISILVKAAAWRVYGQPTWIPLNPNDWVLVSIPTGVDVEYQKSADNNVYVGKCPDSTQTFTFSIRSAIGIGVGKYTTNATCAESFVFFYNTNYQGRTVIAYNAANGTVIRIEDL